LLIAGDLSYADGDPTRWDSWLELAEPLLRSVPFASVPGNHEIECDQVTHDVFVPYESFFRNPNRRYDYGNAYYSYRHGLVHTIMLNSYTSILDGSLQRTWLTEIALPNVDKSITPWLIIVFHTPLYTTFKSHINEINPTLMKDSGIRQLFQRYKVNLVISGHDHAYMRTKPLNPNGSVAESKAGPIFWTLGAGGNREGHSEYINPIQQEDWVDKRDDDEFGFGLFFAQNYTHAHIQWMRDDDNN
ncbi:Metallo-dependent phosphatase, partial [Fragilariopsis cylindrus CCMP1102]